MEEKDLKACVYVCPRCFNKIEKCTCDMLPFELIHIDKNILPIIKILNEKGYFTDMCCEGHIGKTQNPFIYISFRKGYKIKTPAPKGVVYNEGGLRADIPGSSDEAKKRNKRNLLKSIYEWACELEDRKPQGLKLW